MFYYWFFVIKTLIFRPFQSELDMLTPISRTFRVKLLDCDGLRVMTASKYPMYMDLIRWELIARSKLFKAMYKRGLAPTLGSQKLIYRKPLKVWSQFKMVMKAVGWDDKWVYFTHYFVQDGEVKAIGVARGLVWRRDKPHLLSEIIAEADGPSYPVPPPTWVMKLFEDDKNIIEEAHSEMEDWLF